MGATRLDTAAAMLHAREPTEKIVDYLRKSGRPDTGGTRAFVTAGSLNSIISQTKIRYYETYGPPASYTNQLAQLEAAVADSLSDTSKAREFLAKSFADQRSRIMRGTAPMLSDDRVVNQRFAALRPDEQHVLDLRLPPVELARARADKLLVRRNKAHRRNLPFPVRNGDFCLEWCARHLRAHNDDALSLGDAEIATALLVVTGRRLLDIVSGLSAFEPTRQQYVTRFTGISYGNTQSMCIQTLLPFQAWHPAYLSRFAKHASAHARIPHSIRSSLLNNEYRSAVMRHAPVATSCAEVTVHAIRSIYAHLCYQAFGLWGVARVKYGAFARTVLGCADTERVEISNLTVCFDWAEALVVERTGGARCAPVAPQP